jgi:predicted transport protein/ribosomal protein S6
MILFNNGNKYQERRYDNEERLEQEVTKNYKLFFGKDTIFINDKKRVDAKALGGTVPDGFLFDLSSRNAPAFYLVEVELSKHHFYNHVFPQITRFFAFLKNPESRNDLVGKLHEIVETTAELKNEFQKYLGGRELYKFIKDTVDNNHYILLVFDEEKKEINELFETYTDTWGTMVRQVVLRRFEFKGEEIYSLQPEFEDIDFSVGEPPISTEDSESPVYSEESHLELANADTRALYLTLKGKLKKVNRELKFNPRKYYIAVALRKNIAYVSMTKKRVNLVILMPENKVKKIIKRHDIRHLSESVQGYYGGPCCGLLLVNGKYMGDIVKLFKELIVYNTA